MASVDVSERANREVEFGVAGGPAIGPKVPDVEVVARSNGANGIAQVAATYVGMALALDKDTIAPALRSPRISPSTL